MLGESNRGVHHQSMVPPEDTSAAVWRSPTSPWSAMGGYRCTSPPSPGRRPALPEVGTDPLAPVMRSHARRAPGVSTAHAGEVTGCATGHAGEAPGSVRPRGG